MKYFDGKDIRLGDRLSLGQGCEGIVVALLDSGEFSDAYPKSEWSYLKTGVLIDSPELGIVHYLKPEAEIVLLEREKERS